MPKRNLLNVVISTILFFVMLCAPAQAQSNLKIGQECESIATGVGPVIGNNNQCVTDNCEESNVKNSDGNERWFCTCDTGADCAAQYGGNPDDWSCSNGADATHDLNYCKREKNLFSNKNDNIRAPIGLTSPSVIDALFDPSAAALSTVNEIEQITRAPQLAINIPGISFTDPQSITPVNEDRSVLYIPFLAEYIASVYRYAVVAAGVVAVIIIIVAGLRWILSAGSSDAIGSAKKQIVGGVTGLILAVGSYTLLYTINPELVRFRSLRLVTVPEQPLPGFIEHEGDFDPVSTGAPLSTKAVCRSKDSCRTWCSEHPDPATWPTHTQGMLDPAQAQSGFSAPGVRIAKSSVIVPNQLIEPLQAVGQLAQNHPEGPFTVVITTAYRPLSRQIELVCDKFPAGEESDIGVTVAWPGESNHGKGTAVDVILIRDADKKRMTTFGIEESLDKRWRDGIRIMSGIFYQAGWQRLTKEIWHFEYNESRKDCRTNTCLTAPAGAKGIERCICPGSN